MEVLNIFGTTPLVGEWEPQGAKNAVLPIMASALMIEGQVILHHVPDLTDVTAMIKILESFHCTVKKEGETLTIDTHKIKEATVDEELMRTMRASNLIWSPLLYRFGSAKIPMPGGCSIGSRPMDIHLKGLREFGITIEEHGGAFYSETKGLVGNEIYLDFPSVGATENLISAAVCAKGTTVLRNVAREPEIVDFCNFLNTAGASIWGMGGDCLMIEGVKKLHSTEYKIMPDRIVGGTLLLGAVMTKGNVRLNHVVSEHMEALLAKLHQAGVTVKKTENTVEVRNEGRISGVNLKTMPYPGFPTDLQSQFVAMLSLAEGTSVIHESIFENRFQYCNELKKMGADIKVEGQISIVQGVPHLEGAVVEAPDLRGGAALVLGAIAAKGDSQVGHLEYIDRGYCRIEEVLNHLGANICRKKS